MASVFPMGILGQILKRATLLIGYRLRARVKAIT
jgi:hypothetical protein